MSSGNFTTITPRTNGKRLLFIPRCVQQTYLTFPRERCEINYAYRICYIYYVSCDEPQLQYILGILFCHYITIQSTTLLFEFYLIPNHMLFINFVKLMLVQPLPLVDNAHAVRSRKSVVANIFIPLNLRLPSIRVSEITRDCVLNTPLSRRHVGPTYSSTAFHPGDFRHARSHLASPRLTVVIMFMVYDLLVSICLIISLFSKELSTRTITTALFTTCLN